MQLKQLNRKSSPLHEYRLQNSCPDSHSKRPIAAVTVCRGPPGALFSSTTETRALFAAVSPSAVGPASPRVMQILVGSRLSLTDSAEQFCSEESNDESRLEMLRNTISPGNQTLIPHFLVLPHFTIILPIQLLHQLRQRSSGHLIRRIGDEESGGVVCS
jgi:hypothetical protein